jgi:hypothetical protein
MKTRIPAKLLASFFAIGQAIAAPIAHYTFDVNDGGTTPDSVGSAFATLGSRVQINASVPDQIGGGALEMLGAGDDYGPGNGAVTSNSFSWADDARTVTFWWKAKSPNVNTLDGTFVSFGTEPTAGARFDIKEQHASPSVNTMLRVEVQGTGLGTNPTNFDDANWHFVAVTVPSGATFADISWFAGVRGGTLSGDLNTSTNPLEIATGSSAIAFGDSVITTITLPAVNKDRVPNGYLDDFQLYDRVLTQEEILFLFNNPGSVIGVEVQPTITSFTAVGGGVWELTLQAEANANYQFRSSTTLEFNPGTLVENLTQGDPGDPGTIGGPNNSVLTIDANGMGTVRLILSGDPRDFVRAVSLP